MSLTDNPPSLALSDIMHTMSPSPVPPDEHATNVYDFGSGEASKAANTSTENYSQIDVASLRQRLNDLGYPVARQQNGGENALPSGISSREKELLDMVLSLMKSVPIDPAQLERQAQTISDLTTQRDFLIRQAAEDRERWQSERESWERSAEALLLVRNKPSKPEDAERMRVSYEAENKALRDKLHETQRRQASLEAELLKLKPMLLMQPASLSRPDKGKAREVTQPKYQVEFVEQGLNQTQHNALKKQMAAKVVVNSPATASTSKAPATTAAPPSANAESNPPAQQRRSREPKSQPKKIGPPLMSDAYSEHLLLAAKRLGRKRVAIIAGYNQQAEREKEALAQEQDQTRSQQDQERMEQDRQERVANGAFGAYYRTGAEASTSTSTTSPIRVPHIIPVLGNSPLRTPKRGGIHFSNFASAQNNLAAPVPETPLVYVNVNPVTRSPWAGSGVMGTPGQIKATLGRQNGRTTTANEKAPASNPPTPLASLLDAALMIDGEGSTVNKLRGSKTNGKGRAMDEPESPVPPPKRRRVSAAGSGSKHAAGNVGQGKGLERVKTALDVLADQADQASAAFNEPDQSERRSSVANANGNATSKGKGKAKERLHDHHPTEDRGDKHDGEMEVEQRVDESGAASGSGQGRGKGTRRESAGSRTRTVVPPSQISVISSRPIRQSSRKHAASPIQPTASTSTSMTNASARGSARGRGRPKGSANSRPQRGRSDSDAGSVRVISPPGPRIISTPGPRVIAPGPGYSPLDEAIALSSSSGAGKAREIEKRRSEEHDYAQARAPPQSQHQSQVREQPQLESNVPKIGGLRPVVGWGQRDRPSSFDSDSSPVRGNEPRLSPPPDNRNDNDDDNDDKDDNNDKDDDTASHSELVSEPSAPAATISTVEPAPESMSVEPAPTTESIPAEPAPAPESTSAEPAPTTESVSQSAPESPRPREVDGSLTAELAKSINGHILGDLLSVSPFPHSPSPTPTVQSAVGADADVQMKDPDPVVDEDVDAEADADADDDQDAEGEQEDDEEDDGKDGDGDSNSMQHPSRSRSPPPPDPPPPGPSSGSPPGPGQDDEHDPDADAEGEVEFEDNEDHSDGNMGTTLSSSHRADTTDSSSSIPLRTHRPTSPYSTNEIPKSTCAASREHTPVFIDASGLSDSPNTAALGLIISVLANIPAKLEPKQGWCANESRFRMFPAKRANTISFKWRKTDGARLEQIGIPDDSACLTNSSLFESRSFNTTTLLRPPTINIRPSCGASPFSIPSLKVVS